MSCPHCETELTPHDTLYGIKRGALHCDGCGCCFLADGKTQREGVPLCAQAEAEVEADEEPEDEDEDDADEPDGESAPARPSRSRR